MDLDEKSLELEKKSALNKINYIKKRKKREKSISAAKYVLDDGIIELNLDQVVKTEIESFDIGDTTDNYDKQILLPEECVEEEIKSDEKIIPGDFVPEL